MPREELRHEIAHGVRFWGFEQDGQLLGVMGLQDVEEVTLIRHAYVRTTHRRRGIGGRLLNDLRSKATRPLLVGTWAAAEWAIEFYRRHGFEMVPRDQVPSCCAVIGLCPSARSRPPSCWQRKPDRSISLLDAALRRRFGFIELVPDYGVLGAAMVGGLSLPHGLRP